MKTVSNLYCQCTLSWKSCQVTAHGIILIAGGFAKLLRSIDDYEMVDRIRHSRFRILL